jgi:hypothetical protein
MRRRNSKQRSSCEDEEGADDNERGAVAAPPLMFGLLRRAAVGGHVAARRTHHLTNPEERGGRGHLFWGVPGCILAAVVEEPLGWFAARITADTHIQAVNLFPMSCTHRAFMQPCHPYPLPKHEVKEEIARRNLASDMMICEPRQQVHDGTRMHREKPEAKD